MEHLEHLSPAIRSEYEDSKVYYCFHLTTEDLTRECVRELEALGVECVSAGDRYEAYGIAPISSEFLEEVREIDDVRYAERKEPPCSK